MASNFERLYRVRDGDNLGSAQYWNTRFQDIDLRIGVAEGQFYRIDEAVAEVTAAGIKQINESLAPVINDLAAQVATLSTQVVDINDELNGYIQQAQDLIANLESLGQVDGGTF
jgi:hypothetical protein